MDWLQTLLDNSTTPLLTAFLLGLLTALSPCPLATNMLLSVLSEKILKIADRFSVTACFIRWGVLLPIPYWELY